MEVEYAKRGVANAGLTTGIIGTALGAMNASGNGGLLGGLFGGCRDGVSHYELTQESAIAAKDARIALLEANTYNDQKLLEVYKYFDGKIEGINAKLCEQAVFNAAQTSAMNCMGSQIQQLYGLTKLIVPATNICPAPMPEFNSWTAPTAAAGA